MRYRVSVSRVQVAERHVRAVDEDETVRQIQDELDRPYSFFAAWRTTNTDIHIAEVEAPLEKAPLLAPDGGPALLSTKQAAAHLGISYSVMYELTNTAEIRHVAIGRRKYITRDDLKAFIEAHSQLDLAHR